MASQTTTSPKAAPPSKLASAAFEALNKRDLDTLSEFHTDDTVDDFVAIGEFRGKAAIQQFFVELFAAFPDFELTVERIVADRKTAVVQWHATGTFSGGRFQGIEPTGKHVETRGVDVMEITQGKVLRDTIYYDGAAFARQIGLLPRGGSPADKAMLPVFNGLTWIRQHLPRP